MRARRNAVLSRSEDGAPPARSRVAGGTADEVRLILDNLLIRITLEPTGGETVSVSATLEPLADLAPPPPRLKAPKWLTAAFWRQRTHYLAPALLLLLVLRARTSLAALAQRLLTTRVLVAVGMGGILGLVHQYLQEKSRLLTLKQVGSCVVCYQRPRCVAFADCGHVCCCVDCSKVVVASQPKCCPICRAGIKQAPIKVYF